ncbi:Uncharacterised protein [uncultured archaeon]|nr:Uncharacterised protein [uncultured archaeon]
MGRYFSDIIDSPEIIEAKRVSAMSPAEFAAYDIAHPLNLPVTSLSKEDKLKLELKERFSTKSHEAFLNDFKENRTYAFALK